MPFRNTKKNAAGCLKYIEKEIVSDLRASPPADLAPSILKALQNLMLAQAQECVWQKAVMEHMKPGTIARLSIKVAEFYEAVLVMVHDNDPVAVKGSVVALPTEWQTYVAVKASYFHAVAQYNKANECISQGRYGEEIGRLRLAASHNQKALDTIASALGGGGLLFFGGRGNNKAVFKGLAKVARSLQEAINRELIRAERDNDRVYMETVPEPNQLAPILRSDMVRPVFPPEIVDPAQCKFTPKDEIDHPLFEKLVPFAVHQAASVYKDRKEYVVQKDIISRCNAMDEEYTR